MKLLNGLFTQRSGINMAKDSGDRKRPGWLGLFMRLFRNQRGNTLILTAALMVPLLALIGSGIDVGRIYVVRSRMQQACDAASLAGRWAVSAGNSTGNVSSEVIKYFNFNFPQNAFGTASFTPNVAITGSSTKVVNVTAGTTLPMAVMSFFGFRQISVNVSCSAQQDYVNTDIILVLDTTGSMNNAAPSDTQSKIQALRAAVLALYDQLAPIQSQLQAAGMRLRYGIVPYSSTVNVGQLLYAQNANYIRSSAPYQQASACGRSTCYQAVTVNHTNAWLSSTVTWPGCIEERQTTSSITSTTTAIPSSAYDLDINMIPSNSDATRWAPYDITAEQAENQTACPTGARRLATWTRSDLSNYLNTLNPDGGTYHDIGMIWGGRLISSSGVFGDSPDTYNGMPTNRFIIFMTDGLLDTGPDLYSAYGVERYDQRVTGGSLSQQDARHQQRFNLLCSSVKNMGVSIWVVAFASSLDTNLTNCASNAGQASTSSNSTDLISKFAEIGKNIGALRLTQ